MLRKNLMLWAAVVLLAMPTLTFSAELEPAARKARPPAVVTPSPPIWAGFYGGPTLGWATGAANGYYQGGTPEPPPGSLEATIYAIVNLLLDPVTFGALGGYNFQFGDIVAGAELDVGWIGADGRKWAPDGSTRYDEIGVTWTSHLRGRVGYAFGQYLAYVAGGLAIAGVDIAHFRSDATSSVLYSAHDTRVGWTIGGGVEIAGIIPGWAFRGEYLYDYFDDKRYDWVAGMRYTVADLTIHTLRAAATYRFSAPR
jgi:opacity protein-like surface antigen